MSPLLDLLFAPCTGLIELRAVPVVGVHNGVPKCFLVHDDASRLTQFVGAHLHDHLYFGVATRRDASSGRLENCAELSALFCDIDFKNIPEAEARRRLSEFPLAPSAVVLSGNGLHVYWMLREPLSLQDPVECARAKSLLRRLAHCLGADLVSAEPAHCLRLPGTVNPKYDPPRQARLDHLADELELSYHASEFDDLLPPEPVETRPHGSFVTPERILDGERNTTLYRVGRSLKAKGLSHPAIRAALHEENRAKCAPPVPDEEVERIVESAWSHPDREAFIQNGAAPPPCERETDDDTTPTLATLSWRDMTTAPVKPIDWHWDGWIPARTVTIIAAPGEACKSWLGLYLAVMTASGQAALAAPDEVTPPLRAGAVLYITAENSLDEEQRRCGLLKAGLGLPEELPITFVPAPTLSLRDPVQYGVVRALVETLHPVALFIDSAIAVSDLDSENDNTEVRAFMKTRILPFARECGATTIVFAHSPKPPMQPGARLSDEHVARGAGDWRNAADCLLTLKREPTLGDSAVVLRHAKMRIGKRHRSIWFALEDVTPDTAVRLTYGGTYDEIGGQAAAAGLAKVVLSGAEVLRVEGTVTKRALMDRLIAGGTAKTTARRSVEVLRGKHPWPLGPQTGKKHAVVTESKEGRLVLLTLNPALWESVAPEEES